jgi:hypothetical protein
MKVVLNPYSNLAIKTFLVNRIIYGVLIEDSYTEEN